MSECGALTSSTVVMHEEREDLLNVLMQRYAAGEDEAFSQLYRLMAPRLYRFCLRLARSRSEADDCFQETFLKLHRVRATYLRGADALPWAFAIARSVYLSRLRYWQRRPEELGWAHDVAMHDGLAADDTFSPEAEVRATHLLRIVTSALNTMSERNRSAYVLIKEEGLTVRDAAAVLGTTPDVAKQRAHRAYDQIRSALDAEGWGEHPHDSTRSTTPIRM